MTDLPIFVFTLPDFREIGSKKAANLKKSGSGAAVVPLPDFLKIGSSAEIQEDGIEIIIQK